MQSGAPNKVIREVWIVVMAQNMHLKIEDPQKSHISTRSYNRIGNIVRNSKRILLFQGGKRMKYVPNF